MIARVFNPLLKTFADRLLENGKKPKQITIAVLLFFFVFVEHLAPVTMIEF